MLWISYFLGHNTIIGIFLNYFVPTTRWCLSSNCLRRWIARPCPYKILVIYSEYEPMCVDNFYFSISNMTKWTDVIRDTIDLQRDHVLRIFPYSPSSLVTFDCFYSSTCISGVQFVQLVLANSFQSGSTNFYLMDFWYSHLINTISLYNGTLGL